MVSRRRRAGPARRQSPSAHCSLPSVGYTSHGAGASKGAHGDNRTHDTSLLCQSWQERNRGTPWGEGP